MCTSSRVQFFRPGMVLGGVREEELGEQEKEDEGEAQPYHAPVTEPVEDLKRTLPRHYKEL